MGSRTPLHVFALLCALAPAALTATDTTKPDPDCTYKHPPSKLYRAFTGACSARQEDKALALIQSGLGANESDEDGNTVLGWAARGGLPKATKELVDRGADVNAVTDYHYSIMELALTGKNPDVVSCLISHGVDINKGCLGVDVMPLMEAGRFGLADISRLLIAKGAQVNARTKNGETAVEAAAEEGHPEVIALLADHGADLNRLGSEGMTPLMWASQAGYLDAVKMLVQRGAKLDLKSIPYGMTALACAGSPISEKGRDHLGTVQFLLQHGANPRIADKNGGTPLMAASIYERVEVMKALVAAGADIRRTDGEGAKAFQEAIREKRLASLQMLLDLGANPDWKLDNDYPALIYAIEIRQDVKTVEILVKAKADVNVTRRQGIIFSAPAMGTRLPHFYEYSALTAAVRVGSAPMTKMLLQAGANPAYIDSEGKTALDRARADKSPELIQLLSNR